MKTLLLLVLAILTTSCTLVAPRASSNVQYPDLMGPDRAQTAPPVKLADRASDSEAATAFHLGCRIEEVAISAPHSYIAGALG